MNHMMSLKFENGVSISVHTVILLLESTDEFSVVLEVFWKVF